MNKGNCDQKQHEKPDTSKNPKKASGSKKWRILCSKITAKRVSAGAGVFTAVAGVVTAAAGVWLLFFVARQAELARVAIDEGTAQFKTTISEIKNQSEKLSDIFIGQQRVRIALGIEYDKIEIQGEPAYRLAFPLQIGGTTEARHVTFSYQITSGQPLQDQYLSTAEINWENKEVRLVNDVSPTETGRRLTIGPLTRQQRAVIQSQQESLYVIVRLEYCDIFETCHYFLRCAELGHYTDRPSYCGTYIGNLNGNVEDEP